MLISNDLIALLKLNCITSTFGSSSINFTEKSTIAANHETRLWLSDNICEMCYCRKYEKFEEKEIRSNAEFTS